MSLATWKKEFYPIPASKTSKENAIAHSLLKWEGLKLKNLEKHGVYFESRSCLRGILGNEEGFSIGGGSCALCNLYKGPDLHSNCKDCPLALARNGIPCYTYSKYLDFLGCSLWDGVLLTRNPTEMIYWLKKAAEGEIK